MKAEPGFELQAELAVRWLASALTTVAFLVLEHQIDGGRRYGFVYVTTADAGAVGAVPVALDDHRAFAAGADPRESGLHGHVLVSNLLSPPRVHL